MKEKSYSVKDVLGRIDTCAIHSKGIFLKTSVVRNREEKENFNAYCRRNPEHFRVLLTQGSCLLQATPYFTSGRNIHQIIPTNIDPIETARAAIWSAFLIDNKPSSNHINEFLNDLKVPVALDDLTSDYQNFAGIVVTYPSRASAISSQITIPNSLASRWSIRLLDILTNNQKAKTISASQEISFLTENLLENGLWPEYEHECHPDKRNYPTIEHAISGLAKWTLDKHLLANHSQIKSGYKFGIYPNYT